jgi:kynurenine formamidase
MIIFLEHGHKKFKADLSHPHDISIPLIPNDENVNCFYAPQPKTEAVRSGDFIGSIEEGGLLNFKNLFVNPHGNGTHTECVEHISRQGTSINKALQKFHFIGELISVRPEVVNGDGVITQNALLSKINHKTETLIVRSIPNLDDKKSKNYSGSNPPYVDPSAILWLKEIGIKHLIIDLPSVDKEQDEGKLAAHKAFWNVPEKPELTHTITELVYIPNSIEDGLYFVNIQITSVEMDASLSKIVLYEMSQVSDSNETK